MSHPSSPQRRLSVGGLTLALLGVLAVGGMTLLQTSCELPTSPLPAASEAPPSEPDARTLRLGSDVPFVTLSLPPHSRPHAPEVPEQIPLRGWSKAARGWQTPIPVRTRNFYFTKPSPGMKVLTAAGDDVVFAGFQTDEPIAWAYDATSLDLKGAVRAPADDAYVLVFPEGVARERALNLSTSGLSPEAFVQATVLAGSVSRTGLLLPAPATAAFDLTVPPRAELRFAPALAAPEVLDGPPSDGATLKVVLTADGTDHELWSGPVVDGTHQPVRIDLAAWADRAVRLTVSSDPGNDNRFDYVFLADPVVATVRAHPRRALLVFVDTLRPDHLSAYGYERDTTPGLTALAGTGARFDQARSVAPWTLPSARTMITGRQPEFYFGTPTLQARLAEAGFATAMFAGNLYLGANFGLNRDWGLHDVELLPRAESQIDKALAWLDEQEGRDAFLLVHLMDAHLPYKEPREYRSMWAGDRPESLPVDEFHRFHVSGKVRSDEDRQYIRDRYDQSIRYADDQLMRLVGRLAPSDVVVFVSDHGEEFWEHGGYEHGHTLFDELLKIPFVVRAPTLPPGAVVDAPVSLLDVTPTLLDLLDLSFDGLDGVSLVPAMRGDEAAVAALRTRDLAFGRPLYGRERWGALHGDLKWTAVSARSQVFDVRADPEEKKDLTETRSSLHAEGRAWLAQALDRPVAVAYRVAPRGVRGIPKEDLRITLTVPGGVLKAWVGDDPTEASVAVLEPSTHPDTVVATWPRPWRGTRDLWVLPKLPLAEVTHKLALSVQVGDAIRDFTIEGSKPADLTDDPELLLRGEVAGRAFEVGFGVTPVPVEGIEALSGYDAGLRAELAAMGYVVGDDPEPAPQEPDPKEDPKTPPADPK